MTENNLTVRLAAPRGFCAGVDRAIQIVEKCLKKYGESVQSSWSLWVLASSPRDVKEICDSS